MRIQSLAEQGSFNELESFSKSKKSPIGYLPFIEMCMKYNAPNEVTKYISKVSQEKRVSALLKVGYEICGTTLSLNKTWSHVKILFFRNVKAAAELAIQTRNLVDLDMTLKRCGIEHREIAEQVKAVLIQLQKR